MSHNSHSNHTDDISYHPLFSMLSEIQKRKIHHLFNVLDIDKDGVLQPQDFVNVGNRIIAQPSTQINERHGRLILLKSHRLFVQLLTDTENPELQLTLWDWIDFFKNEISMEEQGILNFYIQRTSRHIFDLFDKDHDHFISKPEYFNMLTIYEISHENADAGFKELDTNMDGFISTQEMVAGLSNFFKSDKLDAPGNLIFGGWN